MISFYGGKKLKVESLRRLVFKVPKVYEQVGYIMCKITLL